VPVLGQIAPPDVQPVHVDRVLSRIVAGGAPTVANDALRCTSRMFRMAVRNHWIKRNPAADFDLLDAGGEEASRERWLTLDELEQLAHAMRQTPNFGRQNELAVWLLLPLCVGKMELLSARWESFDLDAGVWTLARESTKTGSAIRIPLAKPVLVWLNEAKVISFGTPYVFPALTYAVGIGRNRGQSTDDFKARITASRPERVVKRFDNRCASRRRTGLCLGPPM
jgi:integrase